MNLCRSPPVWVAWIEISTGIRFAKLLWSPPVWVAWIEISTAIVTIKWVHVATRVGGVD